MRVPFRLRRGSALLMAILVVLVLTLIGIGIAYLSQTEDAISGNVRLGREAFYAAETGLRKGESLLGILVGGGTGAKSVLVCSSCTPFNLPGGGTAYPLIYLTKPIVNVVVTPSQGAKDAAAYSLYVRNNVEDPGGLLTDTDNVLNLVVVGQAVTLDAANAIKSVLATRILEEQFNLIVTGSGGYSQFLVNEGGTGAVRGQR